VEKQLAQMANSTRRTGEPLASRLASTRSKKENPMNYHIINMLKAFSACALAVSCLSAQSDHKTVATVPFEFMVGGQHMAAGTYGVTTSQSTVLIRGEESGSATFALASWAYAAKTQERAKLVFKRYGDRYFLSQVWYPGTNQGRELGISKVERELASNSGKPKIVALLGAAPKVQKAAR
jgi:hypothetical protein